VTVTWARISTWSMIGGPRAPRRGVCRSAWRRAVELGQLERHKLRSGSRSPTLLPRAGVDAANGAVTIKSVKC
jgi:hypothetical protein